jgi:hypothetical protein
MPVWLMILPFVLRLRCVPMWVSSHVPCQTSEEQGRRAAEEAWIERQKAKRAEERKVRLFLCHGCKHAGLLEPRLCGGVHQQGSDNDGRPSTARPCARCPPPSLPISQIRDMEALRKEEEDRAAREAAEQARREEAQRLRDEEAKKKKKGGKKKK